MLSRPLLTNNTNRNNIRYKATLLLCEPLFVDLLGVNARNIYHSVLPPWPTSLSILLTSLFLGKFSSHHIFRNVLPDPLRTTSNSQPLWIPLIHVTYFISEGGGSTSVRRFCTFLTKYTVPHRKSKCQVNYGLQNPLAFIRKSKE